MLKSSASSHEAAKQALRQQKLEEMKSKNPVMAQRYEEALRAGQEAYEYSQKWDAIEQTEQDEYIAKRYGGSQKPEVPSVTAEEEFQPQERSKSPEELAALEKLITVGFLEGYDRSQIATALGIASRAQDSGKEPQQSAPPSVSPEEAGLVSRLQWLQSNRPSDAGHISERREIMGKLAQMRGDK